MNFLSILKSINIRTVQATPYVITAAVAAEALGPDATGAEKASVVTQAVVQTLAGSTNVTAQELAGTISLVVLVANLIGAFKRKAQPAPVAE